MVMQAARLQAASRPQAPELPRPFPRRPPRLLPKLPQGRMPAPRLGLSPLPKDQQRNRLRLQQRRLRQLNDDQDTQAA